MATDLERFVEAPGRDEKIKEVREMIDRMGIEYLYLQFVSITGKIMGKGIPADHWESVAKKGFPAGLWRDGQPVYRPRR
jgi:glutamine synthetase